MTKPDSVLLVCLIHRRGTEADDDGELHEPHACPTCGAECDGDSPCLVIVETEER